VHGDYTPLRASFLVPGLAWGGSAPSKQGRERSWRYKRNNTQEEGTVYLRAYSVLLELGGAEANRAPGLRALATSMR